MKLLLAETFDRRPTLIGIAGPNGAGKSTFFNAHLRYTHLPFVNADLIAAGSGLGVYEAAEVAESIRQQMFTLRESFVFETVFSDPVGKKLQFLVDAKAAGYAVVLFFIGISSPSKSVDRVSMRVLQGGHDVPSDKLATRFPRVMENLRLAMRRLPLVLVYDNDDLREPHRFVAAARRGTIVELAERVPEWLSDLLPRR